MKLPISWLGEFVNIKEYSIKQLSDILVNLGLEVEEIRYYGAGMEQVVAGRIAQIAPHPDADKLKVCTIETEKNRKLSIVTGASNIQEGDIVPVALEGAVLPCGKIIKSAALRGIVSQGMLCSGQELGIDSNTINGAEVDGILILSSDIQPGTNMADALSMNDYIFDISVTSNRPDCQSILGIAREVAASIDSKLVLPALSYKASTMEPHVNLPNVQIEDYTRCSRYFGDLITDIMIKKSPDWMRRRLMMCGVRPINSIVDVTNYVLLEVGQPLHAFDYAHVAGGEIHVRSALKKEKIVALNGNTYHLDETMLVIADKEKPLAIAGVMGGARSSINDQTKIVFLETARFSKSSIRLTSRSLGLRSDSSARYERGLDYQTVETGRSRALHLIYDLGIGTIIDAPAYDGIKQPECKTIRTSRPQILSVLGIDIDMRTIVRLLHALEFETQIDGEEIQCRVPLFREDIDNFSDLSEEIIRLYGYDKIQSAMPHSTCSTVGGPSLKEKNVRLIKQILCARGLYEINTFSFMSAKDLDKLRLDANDTRRMAIRLANPLSEEQCFMRTQLVSGMLHVLSMNHSRKNENLRLFECSKSFIPKKLPLKELPREEDCLCFALTGNTVDFFTAKGIAEDILDFFGVRCTFNRSTQSFLHPGIGADIICGKQQIGFLGKVHPLTREAFSLTEDSYICQLNLGIFIEKALQVVKVQPLPKFPAVYRDLAIIVGEKHPIGDIIRTIQSDAGKACEAVELFDIYQGPQIEKGFKSAAFSIVFRLPDRTMNDQEVQKIMDHITGELQKTFQAKLR